MDRFFLGGYLSEHLEKCNYKLHFLEKRKLAGTANGTPPPRKETGLESFVLHPGN